VLGLGAILAWVVVTNALNPPRASSLAADTGARLSSFSGRGWVYVVATYDSHDLRLYEDARLIASAPAAGQPGHGHGLRPRPAGERDPVHPPGRRAQRRLAECGATHGDRGRRLGRPRPHTSNAIRLLGLPPPVQRRVAAGVLSAGHARALLGLTAPDRIEELAARVVAEGLSVRSTEEMLKIVPNELREASYAAAAPIRGAGLAVAVNSVQLLPTNLHVSPRKLKDAPAPPNTTSELS